MSLIIKSFFLIFLVLLGNSLSNVVPGTRPDEENDQGNTNQQTYIQTELTNQLWEEYWSDWVNIGVIHDNDTVFEFAPDSEEAESRFLSFLHQEFRSGTHSTRDCVDRHSQDCQSWQSQGFCTHINYNFRSWMIKNCPQSCNLCTTEGGGTSEEKECRNKRDSCDLLFRFCTGPFEEHMVRWCPQTCNLCSTTDSNSENLDREGMARVVTASTAAPDTTTIEAPTSGNCFPATCGIAPTLMQRRRAKRSDEQRPPPLTLKIVGGSRAIKGEWPWHGLLLQQVNEHARFCGITIICRYWIVTAAHCVASPEQGFSFTRQVMKTFTLYVGRHQGLFGFPEESTQAFTERDFDRFIVHPAFQLSPSFSHDIALIKLKWSSPIQFNRFVQPVCLPSVNDLSHGDILTTYGWGSTMNVGPSDQYLKDVRVPFVTKEMCGRRIWGLETRGIICAGGIENKDTCTGDSGGSLVMTRPTNDTYGERFYFYGVTSYGTYYCNTRTPYKPGVYTDVAFYSAWIQQQTNGCCNNTPSTHDDQNEQQQEQMAHNNASNTTSSQSLRLGNFVAG